MEEMNTPNIDVNSIDIRMSEDALTDVYKSIILMELGKGHYFDRENYLKFKQGWFPITVADMYFSRSLVRVIASDEKWLIAIRKIILGHFKDVTIDLELAPKSRFSTIAPPNLTIEEKFTQSAISLARSVLNNDLSAARALVDECLEILNEK